MSSNLGFASCVSPHDGRSAIQVESGPSATFGAVLVVGFVNIPISSTTIELSLGAVVLAIDLVVEVNTIRINVEVEAISFSGGLDHDLICLCIGGDSIHDGFDGVALVGKPRLLGRILVPQLSDATSRCPVCSHVFCCSVHEDGGFGSGAVSCLEALLL